ncbi:MAG: LysE family translocator [Proteobacteria bacterium]|nr:LysE family translocator [Pseudomonadota bacterium]
MPALETLLVFTAAAMVMNLSPGPSNFYVLARSLEQGPGAGVVAALGLAIGSLVHVLAAAFGLSLLFVAAPLLYTGLKFIGAAYLIYLGLRTFLAKVDPGIPIQSAGRSRPSILRESVLVEMLNPKTALFFIAFLPQFVDAALPMTPQFLLLGFIVTLTAVPCDVAVAVGAGRAARWLRGNVMVQRWQNRVSGGILVSLGAYVAFGARQS